MRATGTFRGKTPSVAGRLAGDIRRALVACGFVLALCALAVMIASWSQAPMSPAPRPHTAVEVDLSTGSMLIVSPTGNLCRERTIDNSTWQIRDKGQVDCAEALAKSANSAAEGRSSGSRVELIRKGFLGMK
jgi:hypothetical protein